MLQVTEGKQTISHVLSSLGEEHQGMVSPSVAVISVGR